MPTSLNASLKNSIELSPPPSYSSYEFSSKPVVDRKKLEKKVSDRFKEMGNNASIKVSNGLYSLKNSIGSLTSSINSHIRRDIEDEILWIDEEMEVYDGYIQNLEKEMKKRGQSVEEEKSSEPIEKEILGAEATEFVGYKDFLNELNNRKIKKKTYLGNLFNKYLKKEKKNSKTEFINKLKSIFDNINKHKKDGYTFFSHTYENYGVKTTKNVNLKELTQDFLNNKYVQHIIKQSPETANIFAQQQFEEIKDAPQYIEFNGIFNQLIASKKYDGEATLNFLINLSKEINQIKANFKANAELETLEKEHQDLFAEMQEQKQTRPVEENKEVVIDVEEELNENIEIRTATSEATLESESSKKTGDTEKNLYKRVLEETITTEDSYLQSLKLLQKFDIFGKLLEKKLISLDDYNNLSQDFTAIVKESKTLLKNLQSTTEEPLENNINSLSPTNIKNYYNSHKKVINNYQKMLKQFEIVGKSKEGRKILDEFKQSNVRKLEIQAVLIQPVQRIPRIQLLLADLIKKYPKDNVEKKLMEINYLYIVTYTALINATT